MKNAHMTGTSFQKTCNSNSVGKLFIARDAVTPPAIVANVESQSDSLPNGINPDYSTPSFYVVEQHPSQWEYISFSWCKLKKITRDAYLLVD